MQQGLKMNFKIISSILLLLSTSVFAQTQIEHKAGIAGEYWAAVLLVDEFSKSKCGKNFKFDDKQTNSARAIREIKFKFPQSMANEIDDAFSKSEEANQRKQLRAQVNDMGFNKCDLAMKVVTTAHSNSLKKFDAMR